MIKKIKIKTVERALGRKLVKNAISIGADTAVYHTAFAVIRTTDAYLIVEEFQKILVPKLAKKSTLKSRLNNVDLFVEQLDDLKNQWAQRYKFDLVRIEDCFYSKSVIVVKSLAYHGILTYDRLKRIADNITLTMPVSARSQVGFCRSNNKVKGAALKKELIAYINKALGLELGNKEDDKADSLFLSLSALVK